MLHGLQQGRTPLCPGVLSPICAGLSDWFLTQAPACQAARTGFCPELYLWWAAGAVSALNILAEQAIWRETTARGLLERCTKLLDSGLLQGSHSVWLQNFALYKFWALPGYLGRKSILPAGHRKASIGSGKQHFAPYCMVTFSPGQGRLLVCSPSWDGFGCRKSCLWDVREGLSEPSCSPHTAVFQSGHP